jgi:hypothetical protein
MKRLFRGLAGPIGQTPERKDEADVVAALMRVCRRCGQGEGEGRA